MKVLSILLLTFASVTASAQIDSSYCKEITTEKDPFTKNITKGTPVKNRIRFSETISGDIINRYMFLSIPTNSISGSGKKGVIVLLGNDETLDYRDTETKILVAERSNFIYSLVILNDDSIKKMKEFGIKGFRLFIEDRMISKEESQMYQSFLACLFP